MTFLEAGCIALRDSDTGNSIKEASPSRNASFSFTLPLRTTFLQSLSAAKALQEGKPHSRQVVFGRSFRIPITETRWLSAMSSCILKPDTRNPSQCPPGVAIGPGVRPVVLVSKWGCFPVVICDGLIPLTSRAKGWTGIEN